MGGKVVCRWCLKWSVQVFPFPINVKGGESAVWKTKVERILKNRERVKPKNQGKNWCWKRKEEWCLKCNNCLDKGEYCLMQSCFYKLVFPLQFFFFYWWFFRVGVSINDKGGDCLRFVLSLMSTRRVVHYVVLSVVIDVNLCKPILCCWEGIIDGDIVVLYSVVLMRRCFWCCWCN